MENGYGGITMTEREMLIMIMTKQTQMAEDLKKINDILSTKADSHRLEEIEKDLKDLWRAMIGIGLTLIGWLGEHLFSYLLK